MKSILAFALGMVPFAALAAPAPNIPPPPSIEGKYSLLASTTANTGKSARGPFAEGPGASSGFGAAPGPRQTVITKDTITIDGRAVAWEYRIDPSTKPMSIDITIAPPIGKKSKAAGIIAIEGDKVRIAYAPEGAERPRSFDDEGISQFVFQKSPPPPHAEYRIVVLRNGREKEVEKELNELSKEGYEVAFTNGTTTPGDPVIHFVLKRQVK